MPNIVILTGPPGAGKSTINEILANRVPNSALVSCDTLRHMIKNGYADRKSNEWENQLLLGLKNTVLLSKSFYDNGFNVFLDDIICSKEGVDDYLSALKGYNLKIFVLLPNKEVVAKRDLERGEFAMKERALELHKKFEEFSKTEKRVVVIDSSNQTPEETAQIIENELKIIPKSF
ncbi:MAG: AAA family ATPase [archaeon]